jgi:predicted TIM-barrel fold metal-dependent hydrolase
MIIDMHCHYTLTDRRATIADRFSFEPGGDANVDSCVAPRLHGQLKWRAMRRVLGIDPALRAGDALDRELEQIYDRHLSNGLIDRYVLLAFDRYHAAGGTCPPLPASRRQRGSDIYTSNTLIRDLCRRHPGRFLFGASVHPYRDDAVACVDEVFAAGASLLKWLPLHQNIDVDDARTLAVMARCAQIGLPLLVHYGPEFTLATNHPEQRPVTALLRALGALRQAGDMPTTIVAHAATPAWQLGGYDSAYALIEAMRGDFADAPLYTDISALTAWGKSRALPWIAAQQDLHARMLFGSDFPVPLGLPLLRGRLGRAYDEIRKIASWPEQALRVYREVGFNEVVFHRAAELLPHVRCDSGVAMPTGNVL